jgi:hypothetical protein
MDVVLLSLIVAVLFVLWLVIVALSTRDFRMKGHAHRHGVHLGGRR